MSVIEVDYEEAVAFNAAVADMHETRDWVRETRDACMRGDLDLSDEEVWEIVEILRDKVEMCERWQAALRYRPMPIPVAAEAKPEEPAQNRPVFYRTGPYGMVSFDAGPNASFGTSSVGPGNYALRKD